MKILGKGYCNECSNKSKVLIVSDGNIWSKCRKCGFTEWEWRVGDDKGYLRYLAERYNVSLEDILEALEENRAERGGNNGQK